ncbi:unnamed protein product [Effrenium voratum]|nr:unnamed protein product [Effrenium voratum]
MEEAPGFRRYRYREFGEEAVAEFDDAHLAWSGSFDSQTSSAHGEYKDRLRVIHLRKQGWAKAEIANDIGRSERFVARWWQLEPLAVPRPPGVHQYLAHSMIGDQKVDRTDMWRGVEIVRGFFKDTTGLYEEVTSKFTSWKQGASETKDFRTASYFLRYDREGKMRMMTMKSAGYHSGVVPRLDALVGKIHQKVGITDPNHGAGMYWFSDGDASVGSHRHVFWSARVALGAERIMMVDKTPILMQEGDLVIIGPQRHGVPSMPEISEGSLRISVPFKPQKKVQKQPERSEEVSQEGEVMDEGESGMDVWDHLTGDVEPEDLQTLISMGFDEAAAASALQFFDVEGAIDALTNSDFSSVLAGLSSASPEDDVDAALARKMQMEELQDTEDAGLQQQFEEYERLLEIDDAERSWDGYGDLMHNSLRRASLNLDMLGPQTLYSLGATAQTEKQFFEVLSLHSIRILYDFRPTDYRDEVRSRAPHFEVRTLKSNCRQRHIHYRHVAVGKESAFGVLRHMQSDEVQHILVELVWQAKHRGVTCFLGLEDWREDGVRLAVAEELAKHGHRVRHLLSDGSEEPHETGAGMPDFLVQEEARLRKVQAQRKAGELRGPEKSAVERSTEAVARSLASAKAQVDVGAELRDAENQDALVKAQKRMVRMQVTEGKKEPGLNKKELVGLPAHLLREAAAVRERMESKKGEKKDGGVVANVSGRGEEPPASNAASSSSGPALPAPSEAAPGGYPVPDSHPERRWGKAEKEVLEGQEKRRWGRRDANPNPG